LSAINTYTDQELLSLIADGDESAFSRFYHQTNAGIYNAVMVYMKDEHIAREMVQVLYIRLWEQRGSLKEVRSLKNYLFILARNAAFDHFKKINAENKCLAGFRKQVPEWQEDVLAHMQERECRHILHQSINRLPSRQRQVYLLANEEEMSYEEIADSMQVSRFTVKRHLELARSFMRKYIQHHLHEQDLIPIILLFSTAFFHMI
jgi:RNA polymerase sigma-19 factor, ECF subfamily